MSREDKPRKSLVKEAKRIIDEIAKAPQAKRNLDLVLEHLFALAANRTPAKEENA